MRVLIDMNLSPAWVPFLRDAEFDADLVRSGCRHRDRS
jgi:hypothetical protein